MPYEFIPVTLGIVLLAVCLAFALVKKYLDDKNRMRLREMAHEERLKAIEKEVPLVEISDDSTMMNSVSNGQLSLKTLIWLRLSALCLGLAALFGGIGMSIAFMVAFDRELNKIWPIGFIPAMIGVGLLLFYFLSRSTFAVLEHEQRKG